VATKVDNFMDQRGQQEYNFFPQEGSWPSEEKLYKVTPKGKWASYKGQEGNCSGDKGILPAIVHRRSECLPTRLAAFNPDQDNGGNELWPLQGIF
jgi:hypothetical protein